MDYAQTPVLRNDRVTLEPLAHAHGDDLVAAVSVQKLWRTWYTHIPSPDMMHGEIEQRLALQTQGLMAPWAIIDARSGRAVGMTS